jgi:hypothetical protein
VLTTVGGSDNATSAEDLHRQAGGNIQRIRLSEEAVLKTPKPISRKAVRLQDPVEEPGVVERRQEPVKVPLGGKVFQPVAIPNSKKTSSLTDQEETSKVAVPVQIVVQQPVVRAEQKKKTMVSTSAEKHLPTPKVTVPLLAPKVPAPTSVVEGQLRSSTTGGRVLRQRAGDWKDGPSGRKSGDFETIKSASQQGALGGKKRAVQGNMAAGGFVTELDRPYAIIQFIAMRSSMSRALKDNTRGQAVKKAIEAEIANLEQPGVLQPVHFRDIPKEHRRDIIGTYMFHTEKYKADGSFDKDKCRLVLLSNLRNQDSIGETFCPTVNPISVFTQLNLAAVREGTSLATYDIKGAF